MVLPLERQDIDLLEGSTATVPDIKFEDETLGQSLMDDVSQVMTV